MSEELYKEVRHAKITHAKELGSLAASLERALPDSVRVVNRGVVGRHSFQSMSAIIGDKSLQAEMIGAVPTFYLGTAVRGVASSHKIVSADAWRSALQEALESVL